MILLFIEKKIYKRYIVVYFYVWCIIARLSGKSKKEAKKEARGYCGNILTSMARNAVDTLTC